jgi:hypothetical protein
MHVSIVVDKLTEWIEAKAATSLTAENVVTFFKGTIYRLREPHKIITDNGRQYMKNLFQDFADRIEIPYSLAAHPCTNRQVECSNGLITRAVKYRLHKSSMLCVGTWADQLPSALWSLLNTPNVSMGHAFHHAATPSHHCISSDAAYSHQIATPSHHHISLNALLVSATVVQEEARLVVPIVCCCTSRCVNAGRSKSSRLSPNIPCPCTNHILGLALGSGGILFFVKGK